MKLFGYSITKQKTQSYEPIHHRNIQFNNAISYYQNISSLRRKYLQKEKLGCSLVKNLIDTRASIIGGSGYDISSNNPSNNEFIELFKKYYFPINKFINLIKLSELEGKIVLIPSVTSSGFNIRYLSCSLYNYEIICNQDDYQIIEKIRYNYNDNVYDVFPEKFILGIFSGLEDNPNETIPKIGSIINQIERIEEISHELKSNNQLFGYPRMENKITEWSDGDEFRQILEANRGKWGLGDLVSNKGSLSYIEPSGNAVKSLLEETTNLIKQISSVSGISVEKLGYVDLFGTKAGVSEMIELAEISTRLERLEWENVIKRLIVFLMKLDFQKTNIVYDYNDISVSIPISLTSIIEQKAKTYIELVDAGIISKQTCRELIPNIDALLEDQRINNEKESISITNDSVFNQAINGANLVD